MCLRRGPSAAVSEHPRAGSALAALIFAGLRQISVACPAEQPPLTRWEFRNCPCYCWNASNSVFFNLFFLIIPTPSGH